MSEINRNMLSPTGFTFNIQRLPGMVFFVQTVTLPGIALGSTEQPTPFKNIPVYGDHITYGDLDVTFKINEDLSNYIEIFDWITGIGFPDNFSQHADLIKTPSYQGGGVESDASLTIHSSAMNPIIRINITDLFPISLSPIEMNTLDTNIEYITATASFRFNNYTFTKI